MRITKLETLHIGSWTYVKVYTDKDIIGIGEAGLTGRSETVATAIKELERLSQRKRST